jgi:processive 1,2-diacylglycerol beta-glucosyltransferase
MGGGLGFGPMERILHALQAVEPPIAAVVVAGRDPRVETRILDAAQSVAYPVRVLRFVDNVYDYMHAADALVTKPGGLSSAEALAAGIPMVLFKPLPGQEERNVRVLTEWGVAVRAKAIGDVPHILKSVLTDSRRRSRMIAAARLHGRPNAAREAASMIFRLAEVAKEVPA